MRSRSIGGLVCPVLLFSSLAASVSASDPPRRKPLSNDERNAVLALIRAVDVAQETDVTSGDAVTWDGHVLRSGNLTAYIPFRLALHDLPDGFRSTIVYVRAVTRHDGLRATDERSVARDWLARGNTTPPRPPETIYVGQGELPVGGPAASSSRAAVAAPAQALTVLALQQRELERQKAAAEAAKKKNEVKERDPLVFPFEDYYVADVKPARGSSPRMLERALALPPGEFDVYIAMLDRGRLKTSGPVILRHTLSVPDFWNDELSLSSLMLASGVNTLAHPLSAQEQSDHPYTFGRAEVVPVTAASFTTNDIFSVVYQICNYGAPDSDLTADYSFYRVDDGPRRLFNRTAPQAFGDDDLPAPSPWETVAFATQAVSLQTFPAGRYELEVTVRDRLTRRTASGTVAFTVASR
jgi:hypothetical protein